jgi:predicted nuclease of predicted toxin-antitoxin system
VKFLLDHDVPDGLSYLLEQLGHDVTLLRKALPGDSSDEEVFRLAHERGCLLLTSNRDDSLRLAMIDRDTSINPDHHRIPFTKIFEILSLT